MSIPHNVPALLKLIERTEVEAVTAFAWNGCGQTSLNGHTITCKISQRGRAMWKFDYMRKSRTDLISAVINSHYVGQK